MKLGNSRIFSGNDCFFYEITLNWKFLQEFDNNLATSLGKRLTISAALGYKKKEKTEKLKTT